MSRLQIIKILLKEIMRRSVRLEVIECEEKIMDDEFFSLNP